MSKEIRSDSLERLMSEYDTDFDHNDGPRSTLLPRSRSTFYRCFIAPATYLAVLALGCSLGFFGGTLISSGQMSREKGHVHESPAYEAIASTPLITTEELHVGPQNPYSGAPKKETNANWERLLRGYNIRVHRSHLSTSHAPSIELADGSGDVWVSLSVYHHLHCLDSIRHQVSGQSCVSKDSILDKDGFPTHLDHCMDTLRQWLMCQPDLSLRSVFWNQDGVSAAANNSITHQCVNWSALESWIDDRIIPGDTPGLVRFPDGKEFNKIHPPPPRCADLN